VISELKPRKIVDQGEVPDSQSDNGWERQSNIQIVRIFDALINLFVGLSSVFRRGMDREKIVNLFSRISMAELKDPAFEIPNFSTQHHNNTLNIATDNRSNSKTKKSGFNKSPNNQKK
jgi:hypothetical protein